MTDEESKLLYWNVYGNNLTGKITPDTYRYYYLKDHLGSIRAVADENRTIVSSQDYDMWGYLMQDRTYQSDGTIYKFTSKERDGESTYDYFGARSECGSGRGVLTVSDISCLIIPDGCIGLPTIAALEQGIPVIAVKENKNLMTNDLTLLPWSNGQLHIVQNYWEAAGLLCTLKAGIAPESVRRPLSKVNLNDNDSATNILIEKEVNEKKR